MDEFKDVATIDFRVVGGTLEDAFDMMKKYQLYGQAGEDAHIIYHGVSIPAGNCDSVEEVEAVYESLGTDSKWEERNSANKVEVDFYYNDVGNLDDVFIAMQQYRDHGFADKTSNIVYHDVVLPAGYCDNSEQVVDMYNAFVEGSVDALAISMPENISAMDACSIVEQFCAERTRMEENKKSTFVMTKK